MANWKTAPGVEINETERKLVQKVANRFILDPDPRRHIFYQGIFRRRICITLDIHVLYAQVFTLC